MEIPLLLYENINVIKSSLQSVKTKYVLFPYFDEHTFIMLWKERIWVIIFGLLGILCWNIEVGGKRVSASSPSPNYLSSYLWLLPTSRGAPHACLSRLPTCGHTASLGLSLRCKGDHSCEMVHPQGNRCWESPTEAGLGLLGREFWEPRYPSMI